MNPGQILGIIHTIGAILSIGGATFSIVAWWQALKSNDGDKVAALIEFGGKTTAPFIWFGIFLLLLTGIMGVLGPKSYLLDSPYFVFMVIAFAILIIKGIHMTFKKGPKLGKAVGEYKRDIIDLDELKSELEDTFSGQVLSLILWYLALIFMLLSMGGA